MTEVKNGTITYFKTEFDITPSYELVLINAGLSNGNYTYREFMSKLNKVEPKSFSLNGLEKEIKETVEFMKSSASFEKFDISIRDFNPDNSTIVERLRKEYRKNV